MLYGASRNWKLGGNVHTIQFLESVDDHELKMSTDRNRNQDRKGFLLSLSIEMTSISTSVTTIAAAAVVWIIIISLHDATVIPVITKTSAFSSCNYKYQHRRQHLYQQHDHERQWQWQPHRRRQQQPHLPWQQLYSCIKEKEQKENEDEIEDEIDTMMLYDNDDDDDDSSTGGTYDNRSISITQRRRKVLQTLLIGSFTLIAVPSTGRAGEVGAQITKAVTTSDLGVSVRTSVVKGAQLMDKIDGQWEKFSDTHGLGSERTKQQQQVQDQQRRSQNNNQKKYIIIPDPLPLNINTAQQILDISDDVFLKLTSLSLRKLNTKIEQITKLTKSSFERSGVVFSIDNNDDLLRFQTASQFNFIVYAHFKAYSELILENENIINFSKFRIEYERTVGQRLIELWQLVDNNNNNSSGSSVSVSSSSSSSSSLVQQQQQPQRNDILKDKLLTALEQTDSLGRKLRDLGLVSRVNRDRPETTDDLQDFVDDALADLVITVAIDGDVTLQSQILLQEQGYRLYPNFNRFIITEFFREAIQEQQEHQQTKPTSNRGSSNTYDDNNTHKVSVMDYYFDTNYNSDPDKFEVKEVMLNISIE
jgi:hypothetical protein